MNFSDFAVILLGASSITFAILGIQAERRFKMLSPNQQAQVVRVRPWKSFIEKVKDIFNDKNDGTKGPIVTPL
jgi:hypothetical protein